MKRRDYIGTLVRELESHGAADIRTEEGGKHKKLVFTHRGKERFFVIPGTPSDRRGYLNSLTDIRKLLGVKRKIQKSSRPKKRKQETHEKPIDLTITVKPDPFARLSDLMDPDREHRERLRERANLAVYRLSFFKGSYRQWQKAV